MHSFGDFGPSEPFIGVEGSRSALSTPALVLDLDRMERNIAHMAARTRQSGHGLRPVAKIHKSIEIAKRQVAAGALGVCCATLAEAEVMANGGVPGVLLFSSVVSEPKITRLAALNARAEGLLVAVDDAANVDQLAHAARSTGARLRMLVDFEVGGRRTGIVYEDAAIALAKHITEIEGAEFAGLQGYHGGLQNTPDYDERTRLQAACVAPLARLVERLSANGLTPAIVTGGGSGSYQIDPPQGVLTENQAGTYIFMDVNYIDIVFEREMPHPFEVALLVHTTVISASNPGYVVTDAGVKEFAREELAPRILSGPAAGALYELIGDDLGRVTTKPTSARPGVGEVLECVTPHCYATLNLYNAYHCVRGDTLVDIWPIDARAQW